ncbi:MAG: ABC transporter ATP-binding protein [Catalinimonas sp.]
MTHHSIALIVRRLLQLNGRESSEPLMQEGHESGRYYDHTQVEELMMDIQEEAQQSSMMTVTHAVPRELFSGHLSRTDYPVLCFTEDGEAVIFYHTERNERRAYRYGSAGEVVQVVNEALLRRLRVDEVGEVQYLTVFPMDSLVSSDEEPLTPLKRFFRLLRIEKRDIVYIYVYAIAVGLITLSLPLGISAIIGMISGGLVFSSVVILISLVILGVLLSGGLQVMQITLVEILQRRIFAKASFEFAYRVPRIRAEVLNQYHAPELMNRFFDVLTVQKGLPKILIDLTAAVLQIFFGLILLAFYHPFFVFFGIILLIYIFLIFYFTGRKGLETSLMESKYKYRVAHWLEELARNVTSFKLAGHSNLPIQKTDRLLNGYLQYRRKHFRVLLSQFGNVVAFKTIITGGLLIIGTILVINREITLGQFVATEVIIVLIVSAVEKSILSMETVYDTLTGIEKIANVTDLPLERPNGVPLTRRKCADGIHLHVRDVQFSYPNASRPALRGVTFDLKPSESICVAGFDGAGTDALMKVISGVLTDYKGIVSVNGISTRDVHLASLRDFMNKNVSSEDIFSGTILENVTMGKRSVTYDDVVWALDASGLDETVNALPNGLETELLPGGRNLPDVVVNRLMLARCVVSHPNLLILNDFLQAVDRREKMRIASFLTDKRNHWSLLMASNDPLLLQACDRILVMRDGEVVAHGSYDELRTNKDPHFEEVLVQVA